MRSLDNKVIARPIDPNSCFHHLFEAQVERTPDAEAVVYRGQRLTYRELNRRANRWAHRLQSLGVGPDALVGICMERAPEMMVALLGILKAGGAYLPLDASYPAERLAYMLDDAKAPVILTQRGLLEKVEGGAAKVICIDEDASGPPAESDENPLRCVEDNHLAYVIYTSGSTGKPKGVMIHHRGLVNYLLWASRAYRMWEGQGTLVHSPIGFDLTITTLFGPLVVGQRVVLLPESLGLEELACALRAGRDFTVVKITPTHLEALAHMLPPDELAGRVRVLVIGGEMLRWEHIAAWRKYAPATRIINEYGPTETVVGCCVYEVAEEPVSAGSVPIGRAIDNMEMRLLGSDLEPTPGGEIGELYIGGVGVGRGYLNQPETTKAKFIPDPLQPGSSARLYKTGDLARALPDGNLEYLGRTDHQVKIRGYRIELGEIEVALSQHEGVRDCVVVARDGRAGHASLPGEKRLVGYVVGKAKRPPDVDQLRAFLQERLPAYMVPSHFVFMEALPLTVNGKIDRDALPPLEQSLRASGRSLKPPTDPLEIQLTEIWQEILGVGPIGVTEDFFELGGDSLRAVLMATRMEEVRGRHIPPSLVMQEETIEKLAKAIHQLEFQPRDCTVVPVQPRGDYPPLFLVPGIGGMVLGLSYLAHRLGTDQPLYGLQARGVRDSEDPCTSIEEMASYYVDAITAAQKEGPYFIGGYSFGGVVAFEMARQFRARGQVVGILAIFDTMAPVPLKQNAVSFVTNLPYWVKDFVLARSVPELASAARRKVLRFAKSAVRILFPRVRSEPFKEDVRDAVEIPANFPRRYQRIIEAHYQALLSYKPGTYKGRMTLFRAKAQPLFRACPNNGWDRLVEGGIDVYHADGGHMNFLQEPHTRVLAQQVRDALAKSRNELRLLQSTVEASEKDEDSPLGSAFAARAKSLHALSQR